MLSRAVKQEPGAGGGRSSGPPGAVAPQVKRRRVCKGAPTAPSSSSTQVVWGFKGQGFVKHLLQGRGSQRAGWGPRVAEESRSRISGRSLDTMGQGVLGLPKASCFGPPPHPVFVICLLCSLYFAGAPVPTIPPKPHTHRLRRRPQHRPPSTTSATTPSRRRSSPTSSRPLSQAPLWRRRRLLPGLPLPELRGPALRHRRGAAAAAMATQRLQAPRPPMRPPGPPG